MSFRLSTALVLIAALGACGSSRNSAPIVYGTSPTATARIYNSPAEVRAAPARTASRQSSPSYAAPSYASSSYAAPTMLVAQSELEPTPVYVSSYETVKSPPSGALLVTVQPGDTVYAIARRTGAGAQAIIAENGLRPPYELRIGETIRIPSPSQKIANEITGAAPPSAYASASASASGSARAGARTVRQGETLYSISRATGVPVQAIAEANRLRPPYHLSIGQELVIPNVAGAVPAAPRQREASIGEIAQTVSYAKPDAPPSGRMFDWPVKGAVIGEFGSFGLGRRNDGINIAAPVGTPVRAAADGEVVYRGSELDGFGNLLLIKHADGFVTAYAHNDVMLVRKGQKIDKGQVIAKVGKTGSVSEPQLHFEIRQNLKSIDPLAYLQ